MTAPVNERWLERNFPCREACPVHTEAGKYVTLIAQGKFREAYAVARRPNPLASICGRICAAPCESACRRGEIDAPVSIRALKRFVTEQFGVESMVDFTTLSDIYGRRADRYPEKVAVIGSGPAGLACAHDLALLGYPVTIFEAAPVAGGMLRLGVPEYRLPRALIQLEINAILSLGVELKTGVRVGTDVMISDLRRDGYAAVFLAVGAMKSRNLTIPGLDLPGVLRGIDYLLDVNLGKRVEMGKRVLVIGGGNVAVDVARTAARGGESANLQRNLSIVQAMDVARSAVRFGARDVTICSLESETEMPASREEIDEAAREGIHFLYRVGPKRIVGNGGVEGLEFLRVSRVFDESGRFSPTFVEGSELTQLADTVIIAIGQTGDFSFISEEDKVETRAGRIVIDPDTLATTAPGIYAGGDAAFGPRIAINAVADGKKAAQSIDEFIRGVARPAFDQAIEVVVEDRWDREYDYEAIPRQSPPMRPLMRRVGIAEVEECFPVHTARREASRCLRCWTNTIFEQQPELGTECILCGGCQDICPEDCIEIVPARRVAAMSAEARELAPVFARFLGVPRSSSGSSGDAARSSRGTEEPRGTEELWIGSVMLKSEEVCIRCGLCAARCPAGTITMQSFARKETSVA